MVQSNELVQARIGKNIVRKGNKFGLWPNREGGRKIMVAHYYVQGDKGEAKVCSIVYGYCGCLTLSYYE